MDQSLVATIRYLALFAVSTATIVDAEAAAPEAKITLVQLTVRDKSPQSIAARMPAFFQQAKDYESDLIVFPDKRISADLLISEIR